MQQNYGLYVLHNPVNRVTYSPILLNIFNLLTFAAEQVASV